MLLTVYAEVLKAYVGSPLVFDIFISYSHGDDGSGNAYLASWSAAFAKELEREIRADRKFRQELQVVLDQSHRARSWRRPAESSSLW